MCLKLLLPTKTSKTSLRLNFAPMQVDWDRRVQALADCEALAVGNAASFGAFTDIFRSLLRDLISLQIADRRVRGLHKAAAFGTVQKAAR